MTKAYKVGNMTYSNRPLEDVEQKELVIYLKKLQKQGKIIGFWATNNENNSYKQDRRYAMIAEQKAKANGKLKGVADMSILFKNKIVFIEMKRQREILKSGSLSQAKVDLKKEQIDFLNMVNKSDVCFGYVAQGYEEAKNIIEEYL